MFPLETGAECTAEALADCHWEVSSWGRVATLGKLDVYPLEGEGGGTCPLP